MEAMKLNGVIFTFSYGGNGGVSSSHPDIMPWMVETISKARADARIGWVKYVDLADTPITMTRNRAVNIAREMGADFILMIDSDQSPDVHLGPDADFPDPDAKPFWDSSFDYLYNHWSKGPCMIGSPYCGPPQFQENVYVFHWANNISDNPNSDYSLEAYTRHEAARLSGIQEAAALPTGLILFDIRCFDLIDPPYFYYEWKDKYQAEKGSTEDVTLTRDIAINGCEKLGYNPVLCNWSSWAGHWKPKCVGKPRLITASDVSQKLKNAVLEGHDSRERIVRVRGEVPKMRTPIPVSQEEFYPVKADRLAEPPEPCAPNPYSDLPSCTCAPVEPKLDDCDVARWYRDTYFNGDAGFVAECLKYDKQDSHRAARFAVLGQTMVEPGGHHTPAFDLICLKRVVRDAIKAKQDTEPFVAVEVGSWVGHSSVVIADTMPNGGKLHCIDTWLGTPTEVTYRIASSPGEDIYDAFRKNVGHREFNTIFPRIGKSLHQANIWIFGKADLVYIDADHSYEAVKADIEAWLPHVKPGGFIAGHDYQPDQQPGVVRAVNELLPDAKQYGCVWYYQVPVKVATPKPLPRPDASRLNTLLYQAKANVPEGNRVVVVEVNDDGNFSSTGWMAKLDWVSYAWHPPRDGDLYLSAPIDLLFVTPCRNEETQHKAIVRWLPHMAKGGIVCGGGYEQPQVRAAVDKLFGKPAIEPAAGVWSITVHDARLATKQEMEAAGV